ncbi:MAG: phospho-sugar mutase [Micrococcales bacterium]|nr:phospho-sugar mutase [Micrococcales bacterium]
MPGAQDGQAPRHRARGVPAVGPAARPRRRRVGPGVVRPQGLPVDRDARRRRGGGRRPRLALWKLVAGPVRKSPALVQAVSREDLIDSARRWRDRDPDPETCAEVDALIAAGDLAGLEDRFGSALAFGTAGLRGVLGAGPNRMNRAVVIRATAALAKVLLETVPGAAAQGVVVGFDGRRGSAEFGRDVAEVLAGAGIRALCLPPRSPTPLCAYAVRALGAAAGVMVTASHNPPEYNGYKVYSARGSQIVSPFDELVARAMQEIGDARAVPRDAGEKVVVLDAAIEDRYLAEVARVATCRPATDDLEIVYTPLHGVGARLALRALAQAGFSRVTIVPEQAEPDGRFPTVSFPNPEEPGAMDLALALGDARAADIVIANDPDADRLAAAVRDADGALAMLTGNELGVLLGHHLLTTAPGGADRLVVTTIVSSPLLGGIARDLGVQYAETLTGFKWIADRAIALEEERGLRFVFGYEEALGYCCGTVCRDKDGVSGAAVLAQLAARAKAEGTTVRGRLEQIVRRHGLYRSAQKSLWMRGPDGPAKMKQTLAALRAGVPERIGALRVVTRLDYLAQERTDLGGTTSAIPLPRSNVLAFELEGGGRVTVRPSGTEPKVKTYYDLRVDVAPGAPIAEATAEGDRRLAELQAAFMALPAWSL